MMKVAEWICLIKYNNSSSPSSRHCIGLNSTRTQDILFSIHQHGTKCNEHNAKLKIFGSLPSSRFY